MKCELRWIVEEYINFVVSARLKQFTVDVVVVVVVVSFCIHFH